MAGFEGVKWASVQMRYMLDGKRFDLLEADAKVYAVSRSLHYGLFLAFEGIRFYCNKNDEGDLELIFLNWDLNLERFHRGIAFNLSKDQQNLVPDIDELRELFVSRYFSDDSMRGFLEEMAELNAQGYLRPFTVDEDQSIGVTFPQNPAIRAVVCRYDRYLGEPFCGVVVPNMVRTVGINGTGCLKLGVNYLMSVKAVDAAKKICPEAASALFLDDRPDKPLESRKITEWDSSCCLFAMRDGTVIKIPESPLILPSVTIQGIVAILGEMDVPVMEQDITYGELLKHVSDNEIVAVCSIGTAGILNRCQKLFLVDENDQIVATHHADETHPLYNKLGEARKYFWDLYHEKVPIPAGMRLDKYTL